MTSARLRPERRRHGDVYPLPPIDARDGEVFKLSEEQLRRANQARASLNLLAAATPTTSSLSS
eukprot:819741-Alexandrium_andersonii.AAC.1